MSLTDPALALDQRNGLPDALRVLFEEYPRDAWEADPGFSGLIRFWLDRHLMFRKVTDLMTTETENVLDGQAQPEPFAGHIARYAGFFVQELHTHHMIEDQEYFPKLMGLDARLTAGFDILDKDHHAIDAHLSEFADTVNDLLRAVQAQTFTLTNAETLRHRLKRTRHFLDRHLTDEEELVVPILLKHVPSGLV